MDIKNFQSDKGGEFKSNEIRVYFENNNIKFINRSPEHPQTNGDAKLAHKNLQKELKRGSFS